MIRHRSEREITGPRRPIEHPRTALHVTLALAAALLLVPSLAQASFSASKVYREAAPGVVVIFGYDAKGAGSSGTGTIVTSAGLVLTNNHVIFDRDTKRPYVTIQVFIKPDRVTGNDKVDLKKPYGARVIARDGELDLALLEIVRPPGNLPVVDFGDSEQIEIGEPVAAIGHPDGGGLWTLTTGTISSRRNEGRRAIFQTDAAINPGNSGGPLLDGDSRIVGVNTFVRRVNTQGLPLEGLNYSLRGSLVLDWLRQQGVALAAQRRVAAIPSQPAHEPMSEPPSEPPADQPPTAAQSDPEPTMPSVEPGGGEAPRPFEGEDGESFFGYPNRRFELDEAMKDAYEATRKHAGDAFDELDSM